MDAFEIGGTSINPAQHQTLNIPLSALYSQSSMALPIHVHHGQQKGPVLFISASLHGDEIIGIEIIRRLLQQPALQNLRGTLICIPIVNIYGFINRTRYLPDRRDLNRAFPGSKSGSMAARLANTFVEQVVNKCTHGIDLHSAAVGRENHPQIRITLEPYSSDLLALAGAFNSPIIIKSNPPKGSLRSLLASKNIPMLVYEGGEALRFNQHAVDVGLIGVLNIMRYLNMLPELKNPVKQLSRLSKNRRWVRAVQSGIFRSTCKLGASVKKGQVLGYIADPFGNLDVEVIAPIPGMVIGNTHLPLAHAGDALIHIASFD